MTELASGQAVKPQDAAVRNFTVLRSDRVSPGFVRITFGSTGDGFEEEFSYLGFDQWFRLFLPNPDGILEPPYGGVEGWYTRWNAAAEERRPVIRNYTIRHARFDGSRWQIDVDFVLHRSGDGGIDGVAAGWADQAAPGDRVALLDQGHIFSPPEAGPIMIISDESGLPGVEAIARTLSGRPADYLLEVPNGADRRDLILADPIWTVRRPGQRPGAAALDILPTLDIDPAGYVYIVGEASFMLAARADLKSRGVTKEQMDFCAYWRS